MVFVAVIAGIYLLVIGPNYSAWKTLRENQEGMAEGAEFVENTYSLRGLTDFIARHPEYVSITSYNLDYPDSGLYFQSNVSRSLGTTANLFLLIEYERQVEEGILDPFEIISVSEIEKFTLPDMSQNSHESFLDAIDEKQAILDRVVSATIEHNDLAASDYLWFLLGEDNIRNLISDLRLPKESTPLPFSGMYITINPALSDTAGFHSGDLSSFEFESIQNARNLFEWEDFRKKIRDQFDEDRLSLTFMKERDALTYFPKATTKDLAGLIASLLKNEIISENVSERVLEKLRWPLESDPMIKNSFEDYGAFYDNRMGMLNGIDFGTSIYDGHTSVQAVFFDQLPVAFWMHMSSNHMNKDFQQRLIWDPALYETTVNEIISVNE